MLGNGKNKNNNGLEYVTLQEATKFCNYSQEYLSLRARQGKLKSVKLGRNWATTKEWLEEYAGKVEEYNNSINNNGHKNGKPEKIFKEQIIHYPPENLPIVRYPQLKISFGTLRPAFVASLVLVLILAGGVFGKESLFKTYGDLSRGLNNLAKNMAMVSDDVFTATVDYQGALQSVPQILADYGGWLRANYSVADKIVERKIGEGLLTLAPEEAGHWAENIYRNISQNYSSADRNIERKIGEGLLSLSPGRNIFSGFSLPDKPVGPDFSGLAQSLAERYSAADRYLEQKFGQQLLSFNKISDYLTKTIAEKYLVADRNIERKIGVYGTRTVLGVKERFSEFPDIGNLANNFVKQKIAETGASIQNFENGFKSETMRLVRIIGQPFIGLHRFAQNTYNFVTLPWRGVLPATFEELKLRMDEFERNPVVVKRIEVSKIVEPVKEITRDVETVKQITKIDDAALAEVRANMAYLEEELGKRLYAPGGVISQTIFVTEPVSSPKIYQENGDIVLQTLGSGNVLLSAATGLQLFGKQVVIESTSLLNPLIYLAASTKVTGDMAISGTTGISGDLGVGGTFSSGAATVAGDLTVTGDTSITGDLTIVGNETFTGTRTMTASSTSAVLTVTQTGSGEGANITGGTTFSPTAPTLKGVYQSSAYLNAPHGLAVSGKYAYVTGAIYGGAVDTLTVVDVSDPTNPTKVSYYQNSTYLNEPYAIYIAGKYAYITTFRGDGLSIFDISNASSTSYVGSYSSSDLDGAYGVYVSGKYAYVTGYNSDKMTIIDVSNPSSPRFVSSYASTSLDAPIGLYVSGKYAYVPGRASNNLVILDIADPSAPTYVGSYQSDTYLDGASDVYISGKYAYVTNADGAASSATLAIINIADPGNPVLVGSYQSTSLISDPFQTIVSGKYAYITGRDRDSFVVLNVSDPTSPTYVGSYISTTYLDHAHNIVIAGKYAYVVGWDSDSLAILDISGIDAPSANIGDLSVSTLDVTENAIIQNNLYVQNGLNVGSNGIYSEGSLSVFATTTPLIVMGGNVGVATTTPKYKLDVQGDLAIGTTTNNTIFYTNTNSSWYVAIGTTTPNTSRLFSIGTTTDYLVIDRQGRIGIGTTTLSTNLLTVGTTTPALVVANNGNIILAQSSGNVGIATTTPRYKLDVWGDLAVGTSTNTNTPILYVDSGTGYGGVGIGTTTLSGNLLTIGTTSPAFVVTSAGNIGIIGTLDASGHVAFGGDGGIDSPENVDIPIIIDVEETFAFSENNAIGVYIRTNSNPTGASTGNAEAIMAQSASDSGNLVNGFLTGGDFGASYNGVGTLGTAYGIIAYVDNNAGTITNSYSAYTNSSVNGTNLYDFYSGSQGSGENFYHFYAKNASNVTNNYGLYVENMTGGTYDYGIYITGADTAAAYFGGNVGIATTTPRYKLDVWGDMAVGTSTGAGTPMNYPLFYVNSGEGGLSNGVGIGTTTVSGTLLTVGTTTPALVVSQNGYVGVASSTPTEILSVAGNIYGAGNITITGNLMPTTPQGQDIGSAAVDWANIYTNNLYANNIGTASSSISGTALETFTINSDAAADATSSLRFYRGTETPHALLTWDGDYDRFNFNFPIYLSGTGTLSAAGALTLSSGGTSDMALTPANNVGIATTTPRYKLDVWGDLAVGTSTNTNTPILYVDSGNGGQVGIGTTTLSTNLLTVGTTTASLVVDTQGYVGIATTAPSYLFSVQGQSFFSATTTIASDLVVSGAMKNTASKIVASYDTPKSSARADYVATTSDAHVIINAAINSLSSIGGTVYLLEGTYYASSSINMAANVDLVGSGEGTKILSSADNVIEFTNNDNNILVSNFQIDSATSADTAIGMNGSVTFKNVTISNIHIVNSLWIGIEFSGSSSQNLNITNNVIDVASTTDESYTGIDIRGTSDNVKIINNVIRGGARNSIYVLGVSGPLNISNNKIVSDHRTSGGSGIFLYNINSPNGNSIDRNKTVVVSGNSVNMESVGTAGIYLDRSRFVLVDGNYATGATDEGIGLVDSSYNVISNNVSWDNGNEGIFVYPSVFYAKNNNITGNLLLRNGGQGVNIQGGDYNLVTGNTFRDNSQDGGNLYSDIELTGTATYNLISGNYFFSTTTQYAVEEGTTADDFNVIANNMVGAKPQTAAFNILGTHSSLAGNKTETTSEGLFHIESASGAATTTLTVKQSGTGDIMNLFDGAREVFTVVDGGNIGVATTTPRYTFDIWGDLAVGTSTGAAAPMNYPLFYVNSGEGGLSNGVGIGTTTVSGTMLTIGTTTPALAITNNGNIILAQISGNVGIGTLDVSQKLTVYGGSVAVTTNGSATTTISSATSTFGGGLIVDTSTIYVMSDLNRVGLGTTTPRYTLDVWGSLAVGTSTSAILLVDTGATGNAPGITVGADISLGSIQVASSSGAITFADMIVEASASAGTVESYDFQIDSQTILNIYAESDGAGGIKNRRVGIGTTTPTALFTVGTTTEYLVVNNAGRVGIGTANPTSTLSVYGDIGQRGTVIHADVAEDYPVSDDAQAGDVVEFDPQTPWAVRKSTGAYSERLAGVISTSPGYRIYAEDPNWKPIALAGRVPVKISLENGSIAIGDALTSASSTPGTAMKATGAGRVLGYALEPFNESSTSTEIMVFVSLSERSSGDLTVFQNTEGAIEIRTMTQNGLAALFSIDSEGALVVDKLKTQELCVGSICVTEADFMRVFGAEVATSMLEPEVSSSTPAVDATPTEDVVIPDLPNSVLDSTPELLTTSTQAIFEFHSTKENSTFSCQIDGNMWEGCFPPKTYTDLSVGTHEFKVQAIDAQNQEEPSPSVFNWQIILPESAVATSTEPIIETTTTTDEAATSTTP